MARRPVPRQTAVPNYRADHRRGRTGREIQPSRCGMPCGMTVVTIEASSAS